MIRRVQDSSPDVLAKVMDLGAREGNVWNEDDLQAVLVHQLHVPLSFDLSSLNEEAGRTVDRLISDGNPPLRCHADLLQHPNPPLELLQLTKQFLKTVLKSRDDLLPRPVAAVLYYATILVAIMRCHERITSLDDKTLMAGFDWALQQPWLDEPTRSVFVEAHGDRPTLPPLGRGQG